MVTLARLVVFALAALAIVVQLGVWGATKLRSEGALLESWQPYFGWPYAVLLALVLLGICHLAAIDRGAVWLVRTWLVVGGTLALLAPLGRSVESGAAAALTSGFGAVVVTAGLWEGRLAPRRR